MIFADPRLYICSQTRGVNSSTGRSMPTDMLRQQRRRMGARLAEARKTAGYNQAHFAQRLGLSEGDLAAIEAGGRPASLPSLLAAAAILRLPLAAFLDDAAREDADLRGPLRPSR